jgi:hypothetical protein
MKITRKQLKELISEEAAIVSSPLLEMPMNSTTGSRMHAREPKGEDPSGNEGEMSKRALYHMSQQAQQLHDVLHGDEELEPWVQEKITKAGAYLEEAFKAILYDKGPGQGRL